MDNLVTVNTGDGDSIVVAGSNYKILLTSQQTNGAMAIIEMHVPPQSGPAPHEHKAFMENFYVLEGEVQVKSEAGSSIAKKGALVTIPLNGPVHCFKNISDADAKLLCIVSPAGLDDFFMEVSTAEKENIKNIAEKYGQKLYPPDYLD